MRLRLALLGLVAAIAGIGFGQLVCYSVICRDAIGRLCGKGHLLALAQGCGIYETDAGRALAEFQHVRGEDELDGKDQAQLKRSILSRLAANAIARHLAAGEKTPASEVDRELNVLQSQFRDGNAWTKALRESDLSEGSLRAMIGQELRARRWIARQVAPQLEVTTQECEQFFQNHPELYFQPVRLRVSHLFLAAPPETPPETADLKQETIASLSEQIRHGENFSDLAGSASEDEATKTRGGDLGFFSAYRMPPDFFAAAAKMSPGQISQPVRTSLGFHIVQITDLKPARQMTFDEAHADIRGALEFEKRRGALQKLEVDLGAQARIVRSFF
jgi:parvulin-like peptidyl-prolyl isomerase